MRLERSTGLRRGIATVVLAYATAMPLAPIATADPQQDYHITSPSGDVACSMTESSISDDDVYGQVECAVSDRSWVAPPRLPRCPDPHEPVFFMSARPLLGPREPALLQCYANTDHAQSILDADPETLDYGQTQTVGAITCDSGPAGITCTDASSGHFFRMSRESYELE